MVLGGNGGCEGVYEGAYNSSMLGWKIRFTNPIEGDLYGYWSGSSTWTFQLPPSKGAVNFVRLFCPVYPKL